MNDKYDDLGQRAEVHGFECMFLQAHTPPNVDDRAQGRKIVLEFRVRHRTSGRHYLFTSTVWCEVLPDKKKIPEMLWFSLYSDVLNQMWHTADTMFIRKECGDVS